MRWHFLSVRDFDRHAADWNTLARGAGYPAFLDSRFIAPLLGEFATGSERLAVGEDEAGVAAMALLEQRRQGAWQTWQPSQLPLGPCLVRAGADLRSMAASLLRSLPGLALQLGITQLDPLSSQRPAEGGAFDTLDYVSTAWVDVATGFDEYWEGRGKNLRTNMRKQRRKLDAEGVRARLETLSEKDAMADAIASYGRLESAGWKRAQGTAISLDNAQGRFYRAMLEQFCESGAGRVYRYWLDDRVVAVDLCIEQGGKLVVLKTTYDESLKQFSPASLMREEAMREIFEQRRIQRIEFFGRLMDWHTLWTACHRTLYHLNCYRWPWLRRAQAWRRRARVQEQVPTPHADSGDNRAGAQET